MRFGAVAGSVEPVMGRVTDLSLIRPAVRSLP
jgi:hypothetical protein